MCRAISWGFLVAWAAPALTQVLDPINNFCRRFGHQTAVVDNRLYVTGGYVDYGGSIAPSTQNFTNTFLLYADLGVVNDVNFPPMYDNLTKPGYIPSVIGGTLWPDIVNKKVYLWGGEYNWTSSPPATQRLWYYDVLYDTWNQTGNGVNGIQSSAFGASAVDEYKGVAYYYGGWSSNATALGWYGNPIAQQGLVVYDLTTDLWSNVSFIDSTPRAEGVLFYLPISDSGMLFYFGGVQQTSNGSYIGAPMDRIHIFDIASQKYYTQSTSGTPPSMRRRFCGGASWTSDRSSYNIYFYGGDVPPDQQGLGFNDAWILSIPSFTWINYFNGTGYEHHSMSCNIVNEAQMIIMGGYFPNSSNTACDSQLTFGMHNLNLGSDNILEAQWYQFLPNLTAYEVPPEVISVIGGSPNGGATLTTPVAGYGDPDLAVYLTRHAPTTFRSATRDVSITTSTPSLSKSTSDSTSSSNVGAIVGGVVGGVAGLSILIALTLFCLRRRRKPHNGPQDLGQFDEYRHYPDPQPPTEMSAETAMVEAPGHMPSPCLGQATPQKGAGTETTVTSSNDGCGLGIHPAEGFPEPRDQRSRISPDLQTPRLREDLSTPSRPDLPTARSYYPPMPPSQPYFPLHASPQPHDQLEPPFEMSADNSGAPRQPRQVSEASHFIHAE